MDLSDFITLLRKGTDIYVFGSVQKISRDFCMELDSKSHLLVKSDGKHVVEPKNLCIRETRT